MLLAQNAIRSGLKAKVEALMANAGEDVKAAAQEECEIACDTRSIEILREYKHDENG